METIDRKDGRVTQIKCKIGNFSDAASRDDPKKKLKSHDFHLDSSAIKCYMRFDPTGFSHGADGNSSSLFFFVRDYGDELTLSLHIKCWIENDAGEKIKADERDFVFDKMKNAGYEWPGFVTHDELYPPNSKFVKNDVVYICAEITREASPIKNGLQGMDTGFHQNLWDSYKQGLYDGCILKVGGHEFKVSKTLLTARSDVFKDLFLSNSKEVKSGVVKIEDTNPKTMEAFVEFVYLGSVENLDDVAIDLLKLANKYNVQGLKKDCIESLSNTIDKNNVCIRLISAFSQDCDDLKELVFDFISRSDQELLVSIMCCSDWFHLTATNGPLASEITKAVFGRFKIK